MEWGIKVTVSTKEAKPLTTKQQKRIRISVVDKEGRILLLDELRVRSAYTDITIDWSTFELLRVRLQERRRPDVDKPRGTDEATLPTILSYRWRPNLRKFSKILPGERVQVLGALRRKVRLRVIDRYRRSLATRGPGTIVGPPAPSVRSRIAGVAACGTGAGDGLRRKRTVVGVQPTTGSNGLAPGTKMTLTLRWWEL